MSHRPQRLLGIAAVVGIFMGGAVLGAQTEAEKLLESTNALRCVFPVSIRTTWRNGVPQPAVRTTASGLAVTIRNINVASGSALLIRTPINKDLTVVADARARHFIDAGGGRVSVTMVLAEFSTGMKFQAVHTIHDYTALDLGSFKAEPEVVQYAGDCDVAPPAQ